MSCHQAPVPWYSSERDSYSALFTVSLFAHRANSGDQGVTRRVVFNSADSLRDPVTANDGKFIGPRRGKSDPNIEFDSTALSLKSPKTALSVALSTGKSAAPKPAATASPKKTAERAAHEKLVTLKLRGQVAPESP